jgi:pimeloyl-ACP methyl ester carboxylesterase
MPALYDNPSSIWHAKVRLALHQLRDASGPRLLMLHPLGGATPSAAPAWTGAWPGAVYGLDFTGHGESDVPRGGGYTAEVLMGDADAALVRLGPVTIVGHGLGAYIGLLIAGARPSLIRGLALCDGPGLAGGGTTPGTNVVLTVDPELEGAAPDPWALVELARDVRPTDYATGFARQALQLSGVASPIAVCATFRPPWLAAVADEAGVVSCSLPDALALFGGGSP